ncbi:MAG: cbb3-type cytochrome c oxidase N-terminal domain-containing protein [Longimicrobiales bacterium]
MSKDTDRLLGHADEADGIEEYDNPLPDWWVGLFWLTIVWAVGYTIHYHVIADRSQEGALAAEMAAAEARWPAQAAATRMAQADFEVTDAAVAAGEGLYQQYCVACHGVNLEGGIGPSFVDDEWIHGGQARDILRIIAEGVPAKGMVPWQGILSPEQMNQVAAYVIAEHSEATGRSVADIVAEPAEASEPDAPANPPD